jgi:hypothetical protein
MLLSEKTENYIPYEKIDKKRTVIPAFADTTILRFIT